MKKILLIITLISTMTLPLLADETERSIEEIHNVTPIEETAQINKDGLEYFEPEEDKFVEKFEHDMAKHFDNEGLDDEDPDSIDEDDDDFDDEDIDDDDLDDDDFDDEDLDDDDEDFDDEDLDDEEEDLTGGELEDEDFEDDE